MPIVAIPRTMPKKIWPTIRIILDSEAKKEYLCTTLAKLVRFTLLEALENHAQKQLENERKSRRLTLSYLNGWAFLQLFPLSFNKKENCALTPWPLL